MIEGLTTKLVGGAIAVAALTTVFGRSTSAKVFDSLGRLVSSTISASLGKGVDLK